MKMQSKAGMKGKGRRRVLLSRAGIIAILLLAVLGLALLAFPSIASAQTFHASHALAGNGRIYGQLRDGTKRNTPVAGQSVTLQIAQGGNTSDLATTTTNAQGMYAFDGLSTDKTVNYAVYTLYQKAQYVSNLIDLSSKPQQQVNLTVYDATTSTARIAIVQANVLIDKADPQHGLLTITENFFFENLGLTTYAGSLPANGQKAGALMFSLPRGAQQVSLKNGFDGYQQAQVTGGFATTAAVPPGLSQFAFSFQVPYNATHYDFSYTIFYPTVSLSVLLPLDYHATSAALQPQGTTTASGQVYQELAAQQLLPGAQVHVELDGLPASTASSSTSGGGLSLSWLIWLILAMLAIAGLTWYLAARVRRRPGKARKAGQSRQKARAASMLNQPVDKNGSKSARASGGTEVERAAPTDDETQSLQESLLAELLALDKAYEAGTIKKAVYEEQRARLKSHLRALLSEEQDEQPRPAAAGARATGAKKRRSEAAKKRK
jgi:hypothetical protein